MDRRDVLKAALASSALLVGDVFGGVLKFGEVFKKEAKWPDGYDFEFEGAHCKLYIWPNDRGIVFCNGSSSAEGEVVIPTFDPREINSTLRETIHNAINGARNCYKKNDIHSVYCSINKYDGCDSQFGIVCFDSPSWVPKTSFSPISSLPIGSNLPYNYMLPSEKNKILNERSKKMMAKNNHLIDNANNFLRNMTR